MATFPSIQEEALVNARVARLATVDPSGAPHVVPLCFAYDGSSIYSAIDRKPKRRHGMDLQRVRNILSNPKITLVIDHYEEDWSKLWYLLIRGQAGILREGPEREKAFELLRHKYPQYREMNIEGASVIKIQPTKIVSWCGSQKTSPP